MHARKVAYIVPNIELDHADNALSILLTAIKSASGKVLYQANSLRYFHLLLLSQLERHKFNKNWKPSETKTCTFIVLCL